MTKNYKNIKNMFVLPFDHRSGFTKNMFNFADDLDLQDTLKVREYKFIIYSAIQRAIDFGVPIDQTAILVDEIFGDQILKDAKSKDLIVMQTVEKSGEEKLKFEFEDWQFHLLSIMPTYAKVLVRYDVMEDNTDQLSKLKSLSDFVHQHNIGLLIEPLMKKRADLSVTKDDQNIIVEQDMYDRQYRYQDLCHMIKEMQDYGIEADVWKIEGLYEEYQYKKVVEVAKSSKDGVDRSHVGVIILGRNETKEHVRQWIEAGRYVDGVIGFAIGRTIFWEPLLAYRDNAMEKDRVIEEIASRYFYYYELFTYKSWWQKFIGLFKKS